MFLMCFEEEWCRVDFCLEVTFFVLEFILDSLEEYRFYGVLTVMDIYDYSFWVLYRRNVIFIFWGKGL